METLHWIIDRLRSIPGRLWQALLVLIAGTFLLYYPLGWVIIHRVDDTLDYDYKLHQVQGGSDAVAAVVGLIDREVNQHYWTPNDPFFYPSAMMDRMPAFQKGVIYALARFGIELSDQIGRTRGSSQMDTDLDTAAGLLKYSPTVWVFDLSTSFIPTASSEKQYRRAMEALQSYNKRLAAGDATFERRADNLLGTLDRIALDMGSSSATIASRIEENIGFTFDSGSDALYYEVKGRMYTYYQILRGLEKDYAAIIEEKQLDGVWDEMMHSFRQGATLSNFFIFNAAPDSQFFPNHLAAQGFYLLRARTQMREVTNILLK